MRWKLSTTLIVALLLPACQSLPRQEDVLPAAVGEQWQLLRSLHFPPGSTRLHFQDGRQTAAMKLTVWELNCAFVLDRASDEAIDIEPGPLRVSAVRRREAFGVWERGSIAYQTVIHFDDAHHPLVALDCERWVQGYDARYRLHRAELRQLLRGWLGIPSARPSGGGESQR
ncbi:hypothetical protein QVG61_02605 [Thiohalobacter sp. IOR34]|uniref:hypothetical protein n=1 Tax=Thiohalobacter sp. IOR34 TaxID=3057176 RepID=UPI0025B24FC7|nr:hypothetical protein [Thiohalobacter sp. IOR34]WJW76001.1 hypothetical protein QVG61_02605 [Thiohalobacter sp. IOR34]